MRHLTEKLKELVDVARQDLFSFDIFSHMNEILELANQDKELRPEIEREDGKVIVFETTDTGRAISICFKEGILIGQVGRKDNFNLKFEATEETYLELLGGKLDPDSAFFRRRIKITGPIAEAVRFKNIFFAKVLCRHNLSREGGLSPKEVGVEKEKPKNSEDLEAEFLNKEKKKDETKRWEKPTLEDVSGKVMAQPYIRFT